LFLLETETELELVSIRNLLKNIGSADFSQPEQQNDTMGGIFRQR
jgi:hypothetical protein